MFLRSKIAKIFGTATHSVRVGSGKNVHKKRERERTREERDRKRERSDREVRKERRERKL